MAKKGSQVDQLNSPNYYKQSGPLSRDLKETVSLSALQSNQYQEIKQNLNDQLIRPNEI